MDAALDEVLGEDDDDDETGLSGTCYDSDDESGVVAAPASVEIMKQLR